MDYQEWEFFESVIDNEQFDVVDAGPLFGPISSFTVKRDKHRQLVLTTVSAGNSQQVADPPKANAVVASDGQVMFRSRFNDSSAVARGVVPGGCSTSYPGVDETASSVGKKKQTSKIEFLHWTSGATVDGAYVIDWVENLSGGFIWPDFDETKKTLVKERRLGAGDEEVIITSTTPSERVSRSCARLDIGGMIVIIGKSRAKPDHIQSPGFILYLGVPDEETRSRIRGCLSFLLGEFLVHLGWTSFDLQWKPVSFCAASGHALVDEARRISGRPPAPLGKTYQFEIDSAMLGKMATSLFGIYEEYQLRTVFWNYWHAKAAPVHMVAAHFGAAIEALQKAYFKKTEIGGHLRIVADDHAWNALSKQIIKCIEDSGLKDDEKRLLTNKTGNLNYAPQGVAADKFFEALKLKVGPIEKRVWKNRNRAAHGGGVTEDGVIQSIRDNKVLMMLMNRTLLSLSGAGHLYYDYYNLERPTRNLAEALPDESSPAA